LRNRNAGATYPRNHETRHLGLPAESSAFRRRQDSRPPVAAIVRPSRHMPFRANVRFPLNSDALNGSERESCAPSISPPERTAAVSAGTSDRVLLRAAMQKRRRPTFSLLLLGNLSTGNGGPQRSSFRINASVSAGGSGALCGISAAPASAHNQPPVDAAPDDCFARRDVAELTIELATRRSCRSGAPGAVPGDRDCARGADGRRRSRGCLCPEAALPSQPKAPARLPLVREWSSLVSLDQSGQIHPERHSRSRRSTRPQSWRGGSPSACW
jgi:hypothetical protein